MSSHRTRIFKSALFFWDVRIPQNLWWVHPSCWVGLPFFREKQTGQDGQDTVDKRNPQQPPGMVLNLVNNGIKVTNLNWLYSRILEAINSTRAMNSVVCPPVSPNWRRFPTTKIYKHIQSKKTFWYIRIQVSQNISKLVALNFKVCPFWISKNPLLKFPTLDLTPPTLLTVRCFKLHTRMIHFPYYCWWFKTWANPPEEHGESQNLTCFAKVTYISRFSSDTLLAKDSHFVNMRDHSWLLPIHFFSSLTIQWPSS